MSIKALLIVIAILLAVLIGWSLINTLSISKIQKNSVQVETIDNSNLLNFFIGIAIVAIIALIGFFWWNGYSLNQIRQNATPAANLGDKNYWELYYKIQYQAAAFTVAVALIAFFGYSTIKDAKNDVRNEVQNGIKSQNDAIVKNKAQVDNLAKIYSQLATGYPDLMEQATKAKIDFSNLQEEVNQIKAKDILKQPIYIVNNIFYTDERFDTQKHWDHIYGGIKIPFSDMRTISNEKLLEFKNPPSVLLFTPAAMAGASIRMITTEAIYVDAQSNNGDNYRFTIYLNENP